MTPLRQQLDSLRRDYAAQNYPGDLAARLLHDLPVRRESVRFRLIVGSLGGAIAAGLALAVLLYEPASRIVENSVHRLAQTAELPFLDPDDQAAAASDHFSIIPEFRPLDVPVPPDTALPPTGSNSASQESA